MEASAGLPPDQRPPKRARSGAEGAERTRSGAERARSGHGERSRSELHFRLGVTESLSILAVNV